MGLRFFYTYNLEFMRIVYYSIALLITISLLKSRLQLKALFDFRTKKISMHLSFVM
jgi:hypothetical protein